MRQDYPLHLLCTCLKVSTSGYYDWSVKVPTHDRNDALKEIILAHHHKNRCSYGAVRLHKSLIEDGHELSLWKVKEIRRAMGITQKVKRKFTRTTDSNHNLPVADNLVAQNFIQIKPNSVWLSDITYINSREGWLYLAGIKDACTKEIVGFCISPRMNKQIVINALLMAIRQHKPAAGLVVHSDRGSQYCSHAYQEKLKDYGLICSMSKKGDCYDNAPIESFWGILKNELVHRNDYATHAEATKDIIEYIVCFYNRQRIQAGLGYLSPANFAAKFKGYNYALTS